MDKDHLSEWKEKVRAEYWKAFRDLTPQQIETKVEDMHKDLSILDSELDVDNRTMRSDLVNATKQFTRLVSFIHVFSLSLSLT